MSVFNGYLWQLKKNYDSGWNKYSVVSIKLYDSGQEDCLNDLKCIFIMEPFDGVTNSVRQYVIDNLETLKHEKIIHYENDQWTLKLP